MSGVVVNVEVADVVIDDVMVVVGVDMRHSWKLPSWKALMAPFSAAMCASQSVLSLMNPAGLHVNGFSSTSIAPREISRSTTLRDRLNTPHPVGDKSRYLP